MSAQVHANAAVETTRIQLRGRFEGYEVEAGDVVGFPEGIPGFESCHRFALLAPEAGTPVKWLHAVDGPEASFLVIDPKAVMPDYRCRLSAADRLRLGATDASSLVWLVLLMADADGTLAVNLRAPVVINPERMVGYQVMPHQCLYPTRHVISTAE